MSFSDHGSRPIITNITFTSGTIEQSHVLNVNVKKFDISSRFGNTFRIAYAENNTSTVWKTIPADSGYFEDYIKDNDLTIYILVPNATTEDPEVIEILEWKSTD